MSNAQIGYVKGELDFRDYRFPVSASMVRSGDEYRNEGDSDTVYGFACEWCYNITNQGQFTLEPGMYFCVTTPVRIQSVAVGRDGKKVGDNAALVLHLRRNDGRYRMAP